MEVATGFERLCSRRGMEFADPWSDRRLAEFVMAIPQRVTCKRGKNKHLVYQGMKGIMPEAARQAAGKTDPYPLFDRALKDEQLNKVQAYLDNAPRAYLNKGSLQTFFEEYCHDKRDDSRFWYALSLCIWLSETDFEKAVLPSQQIR